MGVTSTLPSSFLKEPLLTFVSPAAHLFSPIYPFLSLGGATALSPRLTRRSALALCNPANPISLATRTKELNDTAPSQWSRRAREREREMTQIPPNTWPLSRYLCFLALSPRALPYLSHCHSVSILHRSPEWIRDGINGMRRITNRFGRSVLLFF